MKVLDLFEAKRVATDKGYYTPGYDEEDKQVRGTVRDWMARLGATPEDISTAVQQAKELPAYSELKSYDKTTAGERKNGTFSFKKPAADTRRDEKYMVYANGQIRSSSLNSMAGEHRPTKLKSPKPRLVAGDVVKSLVKIYDGAFKELSKKMQDRKAKVAGDIKTVAVKHGDKDYVLTSEPSRFSDGFRPKIMRGSTTSYLGADSFPTQDKAIAYARRVFDGEVSGFKY